MDLEDYGEIDENDINSLLMYCAFLRNVYCLPHRTLNEFRWFVSACLFNEDNHWNEIEEIYGSGLREKYTKRFDEIYEPCKPDSLILYARLFRDYCYEIYVTRDIDNEC